MQTYNIDAQTADSAGTATAYLSGVKTRIGVIGVDGRAYDCKTSLNSHVDSILQWAYKAGKSVGIVTTTRVTHATPAGCYGHVIDRDWEALDGKYFKESDKAEGCSDLASQLVDNHTYINVKKEFLSIRKFLGCLEQFGLFSRSYLLVAEENS